VFEFFPGNRAWSFTCLRVLAESYYGGGEFNECTRTISRIKAGDIESWYKEWRVTGERIERIALREEASGHQQTARKAYFRASNYYRVAASSSSPAVTVCPRANMVRTIIKTNTWPDLDKILFIFNLPF